MQGWNQISDAGSGERWSKGYSDAEMWLEKLKPRYKRLVELRYFQERSYEITDELKLPLGTVKAQLFRARGFCIRSWRIRKSRYKNYFTKAQRTQRLIIFARWLPPRAFFHQMHFEYSDIYPSLLFLLFLKSNRSNSIMLGSLYKEWNERSMWSPRKDIENLYINHVLHSLGIAKVIQFHYQEQSVLDVGTRREVFRVFLWQYREVHFHLVIPSGKRLQ